MGYDISIGQLSSEINEDDTISFTVKTAKHKRIDNFENSISVGYNNWKDAMILVGLENLFFDRGVGIMKCGGDGDCVPLTKDHKKLIDKAYKKFEVEYPNAKDSTSEEIIDALDFLNWLSIWVDWALVHCKQPVFLYY